MPIPAAKITFIEKLRNAGYWTAQAGKWHMGDAMMDRFDFVASDPTFADVLESKRKILRRYMDSTNDHIPETHAPDEYDRWTGEPLPNRSFAR